MKHNIEILQIQELYHSYKTFLLNEKSVSGRVSEKYIDWIKKYSFCFDIHKKDGDTDSNIDRWLNDIERPDGIERKMAMDSLYIYFQEFLPRWSLKIPREWNILFKKYEKSLTADHKSPKTVRAYYLWVIHFSSYINYISPPELDQAWAKKFLTYLVTEKHISASTQNQAYYALKYLYCRILKKPYDYFRGVPKSQKKRNLPSVLSRQEVNLLLKSLYNPVLLAAQIMYGTGMRISECLNLRIKDINFDDMVIVVKEGKGSKDRVVILPKALVLPLKERIKWLKQDYDYWKRQNKALIPLPYSVQNNFQKAENLFGWYWIFPAKKPSFNYKEGKFYIYPVHSSSIQTAIRKTSEKAGFLKRVTPHTLRHSFATHLMQNGYPIRAIQELLGHSSITTTMNYTHVVKQLSGNIQSPLDLKF